MVNICFYFQVHQPFRMKQYSVFDIGHDHDYWDEEKNRAIARKVADKCYLPTNRLMLDLIKHTKGKFKISYSISGVALEQFEKYTPEVLDTFRELQQTGCVEFIAETYYHSLSFLYSRDEFVRQIKLHEKKLKDLIGAPKPTTFRNTELVYNNELAKFVEDLGYKVILAEGADHIMGWKSPNFVHHPVSANNIKLLLKNFRLSDDVAFRFSNKDWEEWPLTVEKFCDWVNHYNGSGDTLNLFMDYETFGEHQWEDTGIFEFLKALPFKHLEHPDNTFMTPSETAKAFPVRGDLDVHNFISWADLERDLSAWLGNKIQNTSIQQLYMVEKDVLKTRDKALITNWRRLTTSDHFYYMCTKWFSDGDVHKYFNPYDSPYDSFIAFMNILNDIILQVRESKPKKPRLPVKRAAPRKTTTKKAAKRASKRITKKVLPKSQTKLS